MTMLQEKGIKGKEKSMKRERKKIFGPDRKNKIVKEKKLKERNREKCQINFYQYHTLQISKKMLSITNV